MPDPSTLIVTSVCVSHDGSATASWPAVNYPGSSFVLANADGYIARARIGTSALDCDHCPGPSVDAALIDRAHPVDAGCHVAFGPVDLSLVNARVRSLGVSSAASFHAVSDWTRTDEIDIDGDGQADLAIVSRCDRVVRSGCSDHVCDRTCEGVRAAMGAAKVTQVTCSSFIPDVRDCVP